MYLVMRYVMKLIKDFKLQDQIINISKNNKYFVEGHLMNEEELLKHYKSNFKSLNELWRYAIDKKLNGIAARDTGNIGMIYQPSPVFYNCSITKMPDKSNALSNRFDSDLLEPMNSNDFAIKINP